MSDWRVTLNGVTLGCEEGLGTLSYPPDGLGLPELRTEDVEYPQRDGVRHFNDWYGPRIITLDEVTVCSDECEGCLLARQKVQQILKAWSRQCDDVELVIHTDCEPDDLGRTNWSTDPEVERPGPVAALATNLHPNPFLTDGAGLTVQFRNLDVSDGIGTGPIVRGASVPYQTLTPTDAGDGLARLVLNTDTNLPVEPGQVLKVSMYVRPNGGEVVGRFSIEWRDQFNEPAGLWQGDFVTLSGGWTLIEAETVVPDSISGAQIWLGVGQLVQPETFDLTGVLASTDGYGGEVFSGESVDTDGLDFTWTGTPNDSVSVARAASPLEWPNGVMLDGTIIGDPGNPDVPGAPEGTPWTAYLTDGTTVTGTICGPPPVWPTTGVIERLMVGEGEYFDGDTPDTDVYDYNWTGEPGASTSTETDMTVDRAVVGPFGVVGRPRVAQHSWIRGTGCATMLLRFDGVDQRMFVLDGEGTPGSGQVVAEINPTTETLARCYPRCYTAGGTYCYDTETGGTAGPVTVNNIGTECAYPEICFHGQLTNPVLENITTGETIGINGTVQAGAPPICIDTQARTAEQGGAPRTHLITGNSGFSLQPGENELRLTSYSSTDDGHVTVTFRPSVVSA